MASVESIVLNDAAGGDIDDDTEKVWVKELHKSWLSVEDTGERLVNSESTDTSSIFERPYASQTSTQVASKKGLIRYVTIVLDMSESMRKTDYKHNRIAYIVSELCGWIPRFFERNPLSCISIVAMRDGTATFVTRLGGQPRAQVTRLRQFADRTPVSGRASLGKALELVMHAYGDPVDSPSVPGYATREVFVIWGSISSSDSIEHSLIPNISDKLSKSQMKVSVLSLEPEVYAVRKITEITHGAFNVVMNQSAIKPVYRTTSTTNPPTIKTQSQDHPTHSSSSNQQVTPNGKTFLAVLESYLSAPVTSQLRPQYVKMGFPSQIPVSAVVKCACHLKLIGDSVASVCPQCRSIACELPVACGVCRLQLSDRDMLAGVHRHLYSMPGYKVLHKERESSRTKSQGQGIKISMKDLNGDDGVDESSQGMHGKPVSGQEGSRTVTSALTKLDEDDNCFACGEEISRFAVQCLRCGNVLCPDCDKFAHTSLRHCPGCVLSGVSVKSELGL